MAVTVFGNEGDKVIITRVDFGHGDEYLVEVLNGMGYFTVYSSFSYQKALERAKNIIEV